MVSQIREGITSRTSFNNSGVMLHECSRKFRAPFNRYEYEGWQEYNSQQNNIQHYFPFKLKSHTVAWLRIMFY